MRKDGAKRYRLSDRGGGPRREREIEFERPENVFQAAKFDFRPREMEFEGREFEFQLLEFEFRRRSLFALDAEVYAGRPGNATLPWRSTSRRKGRASLVAGIVKAVQEREVPRIE